MAEESGHGSMHHGAAEAAAPKGDNSPSSMALAIANGRMHKDMDITYTGQADVDFVRGIIAHHQGAGRRDDEGVARQERRLIPQSNCHRQTPVAKRTTGAGVRRREPGALQAYRATPRRLCGNGSLRCGR